MYLLFEASPRWLPCWRVFNLDFFYFFVGMWKGWKGGGGLSRFGGGALSSNVFTIWCRILIFRPPRVFRRLKHRSCSFWPTYLGYLKLSSSGSATTHFPGCFCPWTGCFEYWIVHVTFGFHYVTLDFQLCNWLTLRCLVSWIYHLPPVCWSIIWKYSLKR